MLRFSGLRSVFSLDTLDARFTASAPRSSSPTKNHGAGPSRNGESSRSQQVRKDTSPSRWGTPEFWLYYVVIAICLPLMFMTTYGLSKGARRLMRGFGKRC
jgi:protein-cysteine N-palmitoyltransferase HHAT